MQVAVLEKATRDETGGKVEQADACQPPVQESV